MAENIKTTEAITEKVSLDSLTVTGVNPIQEQQGLLTKDQSYDVVKRNLGTIPHMALQQETDISIAEFLARPLLIATVTMGTPATVTPWATFLTNPAVAAKIRNAYLIRGNMHMRFIPQADAYTYGLALVTPTIHGKLCDPYSSDYGAMLDIATQKEVELVTPYFGEVPFIRVPDAGTATQFSYNIASAVGPFSSNTATPPTVTISVYAWITDLDMRIPYAQMFMSGVSWVNRNIPAEEKPMGLVSKPMGAIARAANVLEEVPLIGGIAKTAGMVANAIGGIASFFGFSKPTNLVDPERAILVPSSNMASAYGPSYATLIDTDPKRSKSIDPTTAIGLQHDQLSFGYITRHWGLIDSFTMLSSQTAGTELKRSFVAPGAVRVVGNAVYHTPLSYVASLFKFWTGSIEYKFVVVCSTFHKGRVRIFWNPQTVSENPTNTTTMITLDILPGNTGTLVVPWGADYPYRAMGILDYDAVGLSGMNNGFLYVQVDQRLQVPTATSDVYILMFVRAGSDMQFAVPSSTLLKGSFDVPNGSYPRDFVFPHNTITYDPGDYVFPIVNQTKVDGYVWGVNNIAEVDMQDNLVPLEIFGERFVSMRTLLKRGTWNSVILTNNPGGPVTLAVRRMPYSPEPNGGRQFAVQKTMLEYVSELFMFNSGSVRVMLRTRANELAVSRAIVHRMTDGTNQSYGYTTTSTPTNETRYFDCMAYVNNGGTVIDGSALPGPVIEFEIPDLNGIRMKRNNFVGDDTRVGVSLMPSGIAGNPGSIVMHAWYSAGEDFNFYGFAGAPIQYYWTLGETPP